MPWTKIHGIKLESDIMQLTRIRIENITCFEEIDISFEMTNSGPTPWIVFIGENGTGKSTLLQMIGTALLGQKNLEILAGDVDWKRLIRKTNNVTTTDISKTAKTRIFFEDIIRGITIQTNGYIIDTDDKPNVLTLRKSFFGGYSSWGRYIQSSTNISSSSSLPPLPDEHEAYRFATLLSRENPLAKAHKWIGNLAFQMNFKDSKPQERKLAKKFYDTFIHAIQDALPDIESISININQNLEFRSKDCTVEAGQFSDGYRGMLAWILDLMMRLCLAFPDSDNPIQEKGIVLIDEIDMHLHPRWQRRVVEDIRRIFPNIQFIITTHSPFIIQDMRETDHIVLLERQEDGNVSAREDSRNLQQWSANQILYAYFGLSEGTRTDSANAAEKEYQALLDRKHTKKLTKAEEKRLTALQQKANQAPTNIDLQAPEVADAARLVLDALKNFHASESQS